MLTLRLILFGFFTLFVQESQAQQNCLQPMHEKDTSLQSQNVFGEPLESCCLDPMTGYFRDGFCHTGPSDLGTHVVCAIVTDEFLAYSQSRGNDLITPRPDYRFPGLKAGDGWCLCISRWLEAERAGVAPPIRLASTHKNALQYCDLELLQKYAWTDNGQQISNRE
ncbi:MAG: DUF2237 domain-containing protein [Bacteroidota bacterium]